MKKRFLSLLLALVMLLGMIPVTTLAVSAEAPEYESWDTDGEGHYHKADIKKAYFWIDHVDFSSYLTSGSNWVMPGVGSREDGVSVWMDTPVLFAGGTMGYMGNFSSFDLENRRSVFDQVHQNGVFINGGANATHSVRLYDVFDKDVFIRPSSLENVKNGVYLRAYCIYISNVTDNLIGFPGNRPEADELMHVTMDGVRMQNSDVNYVPNTYHVIHKGPNSPSTAFPSSFYDELLAFGDRMYFGEAKAEIHNVTVNGTDIADGEAYISTDKSITVKSTYDSELYSKLKAHGCTVNLWASYYLNGEKFNVAAIPSKDNGDGTATKTYSRTLKSGDVLEIKSWLEIQWPDGPDDIVDEHTVTVVCMDSDFASVSPAPTAMELTNKYTDLGTMQLGSAATNIEFKAFPKKLPAAAVADGWTTGRSISVTRDGKEVYSRVYADNELFGWNLKDNIDEGGTYVITLRVFAQKGDRIVEKTHKFRVFVKGSTIKTIALEGVGTPVIGKSPSTINTVKCTTDGVVVKRMVWTYWTSEMGGVWVHMPSGGKFEAGKRYAVEFELQTADGYSFTAKKEDMTVYINGQKAGKAYNYDTDEFGVDMEFAPITTPEFTTQPVGGEAPCGGKYTVNWATNFTPCKIVVGEYNSLNQVVNQVEYSNTTTSVELPANRYGYVVIAYYNDANAKYSNKITITEIPPVFTTQPVGGEVGIGEKLSVNWATNFTPVKTVLIKGIIHPVDGPSVALENLGAASSVTVGAGYEYFAIRAYYSNTEYVTSDKFYVTEIAPAFTEQPHCVGKGMKTGYYFVDWKLNFTPVKLQAVINLGTAQRPNYRYFDIDPTANTAQLLTQSKAYVMIAYYGEGESDYIRSKTFYVNDEALTAEPTEQIKIKSAALKLSDDINVLYRTIVPEGYTNPYMVFEFIGKTYTIRDYFIDENGLYCFYFPGVTPQCMGDNISATLYATYGTKAYSHTVASYSVLKYCTNQLSKSPDAKLKALLSDLLVYGEKSQLYMNYKTDQLVTKGLSLSPSTFPGLDSSFDQQKLTGTTDPNVKWSSAGLVLSNNMVMRFAITTTNPENYTYEITISGRTSVFTHEDLVEENGKYYLYYRGIKATEFNKPVTAVIKYNGTPISKVLTYSVNTYIYKNQALTNALGDMLRATYNYGKSAESYGG